MRREFVPDVRPLLLQKSPRIIWRSFEYYSPLKRLLQHVTENPGEALSLAEAARIAALEYTHFAAYFHKKIGVTFKCWIDCVRVWRAVQILESAEESILDVAAKSGFNDGTTFCRTFRRVTGMTPTQYRSRRRPNVSELDVPFQVKTREASMISKETPKDSQESPKNPQESPRL